MKIGASDYDGTLFRQRTIAAEDVEGIRSWRAAGNKFGVVSGRDYGMLMPQLKYYGIESDYAVCNNGGIIFRADGTPLWQGRIPLHVLTEIVQEPSVRRSFHFAFSAVDRTYLYHEREGSWIMREALEWDFPIVKIEEKDITIGVMICHDWCFPEISRNLALRGAEILFRPAVDPEGLYETCKTIPQTRAFENQCYFISLNMSGEWLGSYSYGHSMVAAPDGHLVYEAGDNPAALTLTLDIDAVRDARKYGTCYTEQLLRQLPYFDPPMDIYRDLKNAPLYENLPKPDFTIQSRDEHIVANGIQTVSKKRGER